MPTKPVLKQYGDILSTDYYTVDKEVFKMEQLDHDIYEQMSKDETISLGLWVLSYLISNAFENYYNENQELNEFVNMQLKSMNREIKSIIRPLVRNAFVHGFAVGEKIWVKNDNKYQLADIVVYNSNDLTFLVNDKRKITHVRQVVQDGYVDIPAYKTVIFKLGEGIYGESIMPSLYRWWKFKSEQLKYWAKSAQKFAVPPVHGTTIPAKQETLLEKLQNMYVNPVIVTTDKEDIKILQPDKMLSNEFATTIDFIDMKILKSMFLPPTFYSARLSQAGLDIFTKIISSIASSLADALLEGIVYDLIDYNFSDVVDYGKFIVADTLSPNDKMIMARFFLLLQKAGILDIASDDDWIRDTLRIPRRKNYEDNQVSE